MSWDFADTKTRDIRTIGRQNTATAIELAVRKLKSLSTSENHTRSNTIAGCSSRFDCQGRYEWKHQYRTIDSLRATYLALWYSIQYYDEFWLLEW